jgi:hypothetical protein
MFLWCELLLLTSISIDYTKCQFCCFASFPGKSLLRFFRFCGGFLEPHSIHPVFLFRSIWCGAKSGAYLRWWLICVKTFRHYSQPRAHNHCLDCICHIHRIFEELFRFRGMWAKTKPLIRFLDKNSKWNMLRVGISTFLTGKNTFVWKT